MIFSLSHGGEFVDFPLVLSRHLWAWGHERSIVQNRASFLKCLGSEVQVASWRVGVIWIRLYIIPSWNLTFNIPKMKRHICIAGDASWKGFILGIHSSNFRGCSTSGIKTIKSDKGILVIPEWQVPPQRGKLVSFLGFLKHVKATILESAADSDSALPDIVRDIVIPPLAVWMSGFLQVRILRRFAVFFLVSVRFLLQKTIYHVSSEVSVVHIRGSKTTHGI